MYTIEKYEDISNPFFEFFIVSYNGRDFFSNFVMALRQKEDLDGFAKILSSMDNFGKPYITMKKDKFRPIIKKDKGLRRDIYEFKGNRIRVYVIKTENKFYILHGGWKKDQVEDLNKVYKRFNNFQPN